MSLDTTIPLPLAYVTSTFIPPYETSTLSLLGNTITTGDAGGFFYKASAGSTLLCTVSYQGFFTGSQGVLSLYAHIDETDYHITQRHSNTASKVYCIAGAKEITGVSAGWHSLSLWFSHPGFLSTSLLFGGITLNYFETITVLEVEG